MPPDDDFNAAFLITLPELKMNSLELDRRILFLCREREARKYPNETTHSRDGLRSSAGMRGAGPGNRKKDPEPPQAPKGRRNTDGNHDGASST